MRKLLLGLLVSSCSVFAYGQHASQKLSTEDEKSAQVTPVSAEELQVTSERNPSQAWGESAPGDIIWEEDFSGGIPGTWTNNGTVANIWEYRGPSTTPDTATGTRGAFGGNARIQGPTWTNGWVIFDSDYLDNGGSGTVGSGSVPAPHYGELTTGTIDLSSYPEVVLEFYQYIRYLQSATYVMFSSDDGATWPDSVRINNSFPIQANVGSAVDDYISINASPFIGGSSTAKIRFLFGPISATADFCYYNWQLDDIRLIEKPNNDLGIVDVAAVQDGRFGEFGKIPMHQIDQIEFQSLITNYGQVDQPNASVEVDVQGPVPYNNSTSGFVAEKDSSYILTNTNMFSPTALGQYQITFTTESDSVDIDPDPTGFRENNNTTIRNFEVTDTAFSVATDAARTSLGTRTFTSDQDGIRLANLIELLEPDTITSVTLGLSSQSQANATIEISIRDTTPEFSFTTGFQNVVCRSDIYILTAQDVANGYVTIPIPALLNGVPQDRVLAADWYYVSAELYSSGGSNHIQILDDFSFQQSFISSIIYLASDGRWYTNGNAFHIAANFGSIFVGLEEGGEVNFDYSIHPNPTTDYVTVVANSPTSVEFTVVITNIAGQIVKSSNHGMTTSVNSRMDVSELPAGIYTVQVYAGDEMAVRKLVVE